MILIRLLQYPDIELLAQLSQFSTPIAEQEKWLDYWQQQQDKIRSVYLVEKNKQIIGYGSLLRTSGYLPFKQYNIPELSDLWIAPGERKQGYGRQLLEYLEQRALLEGSTTVGLGVGLYADPIGYGPAQRLYIQAGYIPDGRGITYDYQPVVAGKTYPVDDNLILWLIKDL